MFWRMSSFSQGSPVESILDKENFTLEDLLDEDEVIQECKAQNSRLIDFLKEKSQVEKLLRYIVEEPLEDADKRHVFKFPFIACELFTCEVDILLRTLVEDEELMDTLFSFVKPDRPHSTLLAGYFSKVVICLMMRKAGQFFIYMQGHLEIIHQLVDLIGITSIMEIIIRLIGADENLHHNYEETIQWLEDIEVLEMIVDKFSSSDSFEVHANATEILCSIIRCAPPVLAAKICSPSYVRRLFQHAMEDSRPKSVLFHVLSFCVCLLDPKRLVLSSYQAFRSQLNHGSFITPSDDAVVGLLERLGDLLILLDVSSLDSALPTTYGKLQPPLGKHRLKIVEFISVLLTIGSEAVEKELIQQGAIKLVINLFFEYPFNNFLHHHVENIIGSCLESKTTLLLEHILQECDIVRKILAAEKNPLLSTDSTKATVSAEERSPPRIGSIGHITRIANKLTQLGDSNITIQTHLQENSDWVDWLNNVLFKRNATENVLQWSCGRPTTLQDHVRDSDDDDFRDKDFDVAALASSLSQAFRLDIYANDDIEEAQGSFERDEDVYFDDESAEVVISSLHLGDDRGSSFFTNSNWFAFDNDRGVNRCLTDSVASPSPNSDGTLPDVDEVDTVVLDDTNDTRSIHTADQGDTILENKAMFVGNGPVDGFKEDSDDSNKDVDEKPLGWVEWRETPGPEVPGKITNEDIPNGDIVRGNDKCILKEVIADSTKCGSSGDEVTDDWDTGGPRTTSEESLYDSQDSCKVISHGSLPGSEIIDTNSSSQQLANEVAAEDSKHEKDH
ncbi:serine/threonine-protein phosphatase 6 regulatory subunit 3-like isoform X1 [Zingiber officinale]|uniref:serine/threonine-protein phosphatase 6 regulatory subunit 3-like isoform X1 n=1 Tax=Zingiber officinale TaxID=94328 RepID=UPI001C4D48C7|nr:serine/threonine-protein phosphatase 6 regulatory subunit 3-like isoform X1 [Zingiber officinale]